MQPYLFPYIGYFQLIRAVDSFVIYDDVNYMKGGWINRNYILNRQGRQLITLPLQGASPNKLINQVVVGGQHKILQSLQHNYKKAPFFSAVYPVIEEILLQQENNLARFLEYQLRRVCDYLGLYPKWYMSSFLSQSKELCGKSRILSICKELKATHYINLPGGRDLYDSSSFSEQGIRLSFIQPRPISYRQSVGGFVSNLSIIDVMMFNDREHCLRLLDEYDLD